MHSTPSLGGFRRNTAMPFGVEKLEWCGYSTMKNFWRYVYAFWQNPRTCQTDGRADTTWRHRLRLHSIARQQWTKNTKRDDEDSHLHSARQTVDHRERRHGATLYDSQGLQLQQRTSSCLATDINQLEISRNDFCYSNFLPFPWMHSHYRVWILSFIPIPSKLLQCYSHYFHSHRRQLPYTMNTALFSL